MTSSRNTSAQTLHPNHVFPESANQQPVISSRVSFLDCIAFVRKRLLNIDKMQLNRLTLAWKLVRCRWKSKFKVLVRLYSEFKVFRQHIHSVGSLDLVEKQSVSHIDRSDRNLPSYRKRHSVVDYDDDDVAKQPVIVVG